MIQKYNFFRFAVLAFAVSHNIYRIILPRADASLVERESGRYRATVCTMMNDKVVVIPRRRFSARPSLRIRSSCPASRTALAPFPSNPCLKRSKKPHCLLSAIRSYPRAPQNSAFGALFIPVAWCFAWSSAFACKCLALSLSLSLSFHRFFCFGSRLSFCYYVYCIVSLCFLVARYRNKNIRSIAKICKSPPCRWNSVNDWIDRSGRKQIFLPI